MPKTKTSEDRVTREIGQMLKETGLPHAFQREVLNREISESLKNNPSKTGGDGGGIPDAAFSLPCENLTWFGFIENKSGMKNMAKLARDGFMDNRGKNGRPNYAHISKYAANGAAYYAKNAYRDTGHKHWFAMGACGEEEHGEYRLRIDAYVMTPDTGGEAVFYGSFANLSFLNPENIAETMERVARACLSDEQRDRLRAAGEQSVENALTALNQRMRDDFDIDAKLRINFVVAMILAGLGDAKNGICPLNARELGGSGEKGATDADIILRKIRNLLENKALPEEKQEQIVDALRMSLKHNAVVNIKRPGEGETVLRALLREVKENILPFVEDRMLDFAGTVYNKVTDWMPLADDEKNDVVLTPRYVVDFMVRLARVNMDSYVWDFALGSGGFLISAMNAMLKDAKERIPEPDRLREKERDIKEKQLLGIEKRSDVQMLAVLNMFLVGDGSSNILNMDSLAAFEGNYAYPRDAGKFPASVFLLNPPYSAEGNGMVFAKKALSMMRGGYAAVIVQDSAGSGRAAGCNRAILAGSTLVASIKMPVDLFGGKSSVQTSVYVFQAGQPHAAGQMVKFVDLRNDGYKRSNRKKADKSVNLRNVDRARERYDEAVDYVVYGKKPALLDCVEAAIDPESGGDWNFERHKETDSRPTEADFRKTVADYLAWEVAQVIKGGHDGEGGPEKK